MSIFEESTSYRPFKYPWAVREAKRHSIEMHWHEDQVELQDDLRQWHTKGGLATKNVSHEVNKYIVSQTLNLFTELDKTVGEGYTKLLPYVKNNEIRTLLMTIAAREVIHQRAYALLSETLGTSDSGWKEFRGYKEMIDKLDAMEVETGDYSDPLEFAKALTTIYLGEGIGLFGPFSVLLNFKRHGLLIGFNDVNQWSLNDESHHVECNIRIVKTIIEEDLTEVQRMELQRFTIEKAEKLAEAEKRYLELVYKTGNAEDMTLEQACGYIDYIKNLRLYQAEIIPFEEVPENPLPWIEWMLDAVRHGAFFEKRNAEYSHVGLVGEIDYSKYILETET